MSLRALRATRISPHHLALAAYAAIVFTVLGIAPLWLDEILQLGVSRHRTWAELLFWVLINPGASPLPYFIQEAFLRIFGLSTAVVRLPAALCSILGGFVFVRICRQFQPASASVATALFLALPLQVRYALEGRGYSQGLLFSLLALLLFLRLCETPSARGAVAYGACVALGLYSHPLTIFPVLGHALGGVRRLSGARYGRYYLLPVAAAVLSFVPWWVAQHRVQVEARSMDRVFFSVRQIYPRGLVHDLAGGGYFTAVPLLALAAYAWTSRGARSWKTVPATAVGTAVCCAGPIAADALFDYFFAPRQLLFAMPYLVLAAASGAAALWHEKHRLPVAVVLSLFFAVAVARDLRLATTPKDDLHASATAIRSYLEFDACLEVTPRHDVAYLAFFHPELESRLCVPGSHPARIVAVVSPYSKADWGGRPAPPPPSYIVSAELAVGAVRMCIYEHREKRDP